MLFLTRVFLRVFHSYNLNLNTLVKFILLDPNLQAGYTTHQHCNRVTSIDPDDPPTHWLRPSDPDDELDVTWINFF